MCIRDSGHTGLGVGFDRGLLMGITRNSVSLVLVLVLIASLPLPASVAARSPQVPASTLSSADAGWPQEAHDAQHTGYAPEDVPVPWSFKWQWNGSCSDGTDCRPGDPEKGWSFEVPPKSHLVAGNGRLYLPAGEHGVWAINESDGKTAWHNAWIESYCTAACDPQTGTLFVAASDGALYKLDASSGAAVDSFQADSGLNLAPTIVAGRVYVVSDSGVLYAVNQDTMDLIWSYAAGSPGQTPAAYSENHDLLVFATEDLYVHAVNNTDGSQRWSTRPTVNEPGDYTYSSYYGVTRRDYRNHNYEHGWPVIAEDHGLVLVRMHLPWRAMWQVPGPEKSFPTSNDAIRSFLVDHPDLQPLFCLNLEDGSTAFIPAVGTGGIDTPAIDIGAGTPPVEQTLGTLPVVRKLANGDEVAYMVWRNGQRCEAEDYDKGARYDAVMGEMVLDDETIPGYQVGDCRFVDWSENGGRLVTDEMGPLSMSGDTLTTGVSTTSSTAAPSSLWKARARLLQTRPPIRPHRRTRQPTPRHPQRRRRIRRRVHPCQHPRTRQPLNQHRVLRLGFPRASTVRSP